MKYLIMCEGPNELEIINIFLEYDLLIFTEDDLLGLSAYHARQINNSVVVKNELNLYPGNDIIIIRVGDKQSDKLNIPKEYEGKFNGEITKYCTLPELEIILIISENLWDEYQKVKSKKTPKEFAKENISYNGRKYKNDTLFYREYYGDSPEKLVSAIKVYKQKYKTHKKDELYLADLLK